MSGSPSVRQLATDVRTVAASLDAITARLDEIVRRLDEVPALLEEVGHTGDGYTLVGNLGLIKNVLKREFGF